METKKKKRDISDGQLFFVCSMFGVILFAWYGSSLCMKDTFLDDNIWLLTISFGLIALPFVYHYGKGFK